MGSDYQLKLIDLDNLILILGLGPLRFTIVKKHLLDLEERIFVLVILCSYVFKSLRGPPLPSIQKRAKGDIRYFNHIKAYLL